MRLKVSHQTIYRFDPPLRGVVQSHRLTPSICAGQSVVSWEVTTTGGEIGAGFRDGAGDWVETVSVLDPVAELVIDVSGVVETTDTGGVLTGHKEKMPPLSYLRPSEITRPGSQIRDLANEVVAAISPQDTLSRAHALSAALADAIAYTPGQTDASTTANAALELGHGVCQDHAHAMIAAALALEIPARYVTGYLFSSGDSLGDEASHAWAECFVPDLGWVGFDVSNRCCPDDRYIRIGSGGDAVEAAPIRGVGQGAGHQELEARVAVEQAAQ